MGGEHQRKHRRGRKRCRVLGGENNVKAALAALEKKGVPIHQALKDGIIKIYSYTSDEQGLRHPLLEKGASDVDETDALFMFGACASLVSYIVGRGRRAGLIGA